MSRITIIKIILYCLLIIVNGCTLASSSENLSESEHPYSNNFEQEWPVTNSSGATEIRLHFENLDLAASDYLVLYDKYDNELITYTRWDSSKDFWTEWYTGDLLKVKLVTDNEETAYGFKIDRVENRMDVCPSNSSLAESYHPYANNFEFMWPDIIKPGASQMRLHFENLDLGSSDKLIIYDKYDNKLITYNRWDTSKDFWTEWYAGDTLKVKFVTDNSYTGYGFKIDKGEIRDDKNVTTVFESAGTSDFNSNPSEKTSNLQNITIYRDYIHNQFVDLAITLNLLEEDDQSWIYKNIEWIFGGCGVSLVGSIWKILKKPEDEESNNN